MTPLAHRIAAILAAPPFGAAFAVRTSEAFAARFRAEADRSGLHVDLEDKDTAALVCLCPVCGAQNSRYAPACFNCQTELTEAPAAARPAPSRAAAVDEARWQQVIRAPRASVLPLVKTPLVRARFEAQLTPPAPVDHRSIADRFLAVFVEREQRAPRSDSAAARFDQRSGLGKLISVFIERDTEDPT